MNRIPAKKYKKAITAKEYFKQGFAAYKKCDYNAAIEEFNKSIEINPSNSVAYVLRGLAKYALSDYTGAIENYSVALEINPSYADAYYNRGLAKEALCDYTGAIIDYNKAIKSNPCESRIYNNRGNTKQALSDYKGAIDDYSKAIKFNPNESDPYYNRGNAKKELSDYIGAIDDYSKALKINPSDVDAYYNRGLIKQDLSDYTGAIDDFSAVIDINFNYAAAYVLRGLVKFKLSDYKGAIDDYSNAIEIDRNDVVAYNNRGNAKKELFDYIGAIKDYSTILEINPDSAEAYNNRGYVKYCISNYTDAIDDYSKAIKINPNDADAYYNRGNAYSALGKIKNAITDWLSCLYLSIKQKENKWIHELLKYLGAYPENICYTFEQLELDISSYFHFQSTIHQIADFELLLQFYENTSKLKDRELLSAKALFYYYLGGNVLSFRIYDEELIDDSNPMSAQELYYYALIAQEIGYYEAEFILDNCIDQIRSKTDRTDKDYYYLGQLYLLDKDTVAANEEFEKSSAYPFSARMLKDSMEEEDLESCILSGEIDIDKGIEQFSDYFHYRECCSNEAESGNFWEAFTFKRSFNGEINTMERKEEAEEIIAELIGKYESDAENVLEDSDKDRKVNQLLRKIDNEEENNIFKQIIEQIDTKQLKPNEPLEDKIVTGITELEQKPQYYLYYIQYEYLRGNLTAKQAFYLTLFLRCLVKDQLSKDQLSDDVRPALSDSGITVLQVGFNLNNFTCIANSLLQTTILEEDSHKEIIQNTSGDKKVYIGFKESIWKIIWLDKDRLTEDDFNEKWQWFGWEKMALPVMSYQTTLDFSELEVESETSEIKSLI